MSGNSLGKLFCVTNFGESHGPAIGCIVDGCPPGMKLDVSDIQNELDRRRPGTSRHVTQRQEEDKVEILSGIYDGQTTGAPIGLLIRNTDARSKDYANIEDTFRPGHADYTYWHKYGIRDPRGGGRSSARLTAPTVAAGAIAKKWLSKNKNIIIRGYMSQLGAIKIPFVSWDEIDNPFFSPNKRIVHELEAYMDDLRKSGNSVGSRIEILAENLPCGLGEPIYDRLDSDIAHIMMGLNAVKGISIGAGFDCISQLGSVHGDEITPDGFLTNNAGGILGGISTGQDITVSLAIKPTSSIRVAKKSVDTKNNPCLVQTFGRHDPCVGIRAVPIGEAMLAIVLMDHVLRYRGQCGS
ncbi:chorismate synthase [Candidatus Kinetoplastibacterium blastocrithidii TCC012E]|uniref:Chorismate synthase n=1 Tax=Candidatus Kinetoplastidibacterium blastocrithidiae TCC012E TaxID=1208922 RepID=M1LVS2_9PROT|nr:chorismate synthase [Candidatus Kinetoplastibacterium blastocrithidii]AFZ83533.1 chorismate synthase [Candidatus Kinetoplastibacterium blastocrithidii (ex Strigomonas culicis)]AGF49652.1 chorismate synthase [Candidatus Kinetoplastibacterium blastocrithidii TCC012E]